MHRAESGGSHVAKLLKDEITEYVARILPGLLHYEIIVRAYADLDELSREVNDECCEQITQSRKTEPKFAPALGAFATGFSSYDSLFDFVEVATESVVETKITGKHSKLASRLYCTKLRIDLLVMYIKDPRCQHIFFGASGTVRYNSALRSNVSATHRITVVQRGATDSNPTHVGFNGAIFAGVFAPLDGESTTKLIDISEDPLNVSNRSGIPRHH